MGLVAQWQAIAGRLPAGWTETQLRLVPGRVSDAPRIATLLGPVSPGRAGDELHVRVTSSGAAGPAALERLLARVDSEGLTATLEPVGEVDVSSAGDTQAGVERATSLAEQWDALVAGLPEDWSDLLCLVELRSSDDLAPAALEIAPLNPSRHAGVTGFRFRVARKFGYGAAPEMARRCLARLDEAAIPGRVAVLEALSDTRPVLTQGPTFVVGDRAV